MRLLVVGAGGTGGYFGGRLAAAGRDVTFLLRPARAARLRESGLRIVSPHGDLALEPVIVTRDEIAGPFDAVLLSVKAFSLAAALDDLAPAMGPRTMILPVLNGMKHMEALAARFGDAALLGGLCRIAGTVDDQDRVVQLTRMHDLVYGERDGSRSARVEALDAFMQGAGFDARLSTAITREMWEKWLFLASLGATTCLMRGTVGEVVAAPGGPETAAAILAEILAIIRATGEAPGEATIDATRAMLAQAGSPMTSSLYRDLIGGLPIEREQIIGDLVARAASAGLAVPLLSAVNAQLAIYERRRAGG